MRRVARENAPCALAALAGCALLAWLGLKSFAWSDYETESRPAFEALVHGHLTAFLQLVPAYGGSLVERAPFALVPGLWGGGALAVYRAVAAPCLLAGALLGLWPVARMRAEGRPRPVRLLALAICVVNPITVRALEVGHPAYIDGIGDRLLARKAMEQRTVRDAAVLADRRHRGPLVAELEERLKRAVTRGTLLQWDMLADAA